MDGNAIRQRIDVINEKLANAVNRFVLNSNLKELLNEKETLQHLCHHSFVNGVCTYCDLQENDL